MEVTRHRTAVTHRHAVTRRYGVPGWGVGEIEVEDGVLVAHRLASRQRRPSPPEGAPRGSEHP